MRIFKITHRRVKKVNYEFFFFFGKMFTLLVAKRSLTKTKQTPVKINSSLSIETLRCECFSLSKNSLTH